MPLGVDDVALVREARLAGRDGLIRVVAQFEAVVSERRALCGELELLIEHHQALLDDVAPELNRLDEALGGERRLETSVRAGEQADPDVDAACQLADDVVQDLDRVFVVASVCKRRP